MTYCGMFEYENRDGTTIFIHEWVRASFMIPPKRIMHIPMGISFETYCFGMYRICLPLPKEAK